MVLTNYDTAAIIKSCKLYKDHHERPNYINSWGINPRQTYNLEKRCRKLRSLNALHTPEYRGLSIDTPFNYRNIKPRRSRRILRLEPFTTTNNSGFLLILIILFILVCSRV
jgi:hypothetical protein